MKAANYALGKNAASSRLNALLQWIDNHAEEMLADPARGLEAIGVGKKNADSLRASDADWCIVGYVAEKLPEKVLSKRNVTAFSTAATIDDREALGDHEIDVVSCGSSFRAQPGMNVPIAQRGAHGGQPPAVDLQDRFDSIRIGLGITNPVGSYPDSLSVGTLGFCVRDDDGRTYLVSNNHVIGRENKAQIGNAIVQPGTLDLTRTELNMMSSLPRLRRRLQIAKVSAVVDIRFGWSSFNEVDAAVAEFDAESDSGRRLNELSRIGFGSTARGIAAPYMVDADGNLEGDDRVYKAGRTTGWTEGNISAIGVASNVQYSAGVARFRNQIAITPTPDNNGPFSNPGDSGSGIWNTDNELVGLLFAGSTSRTLANPIDLVLPEIEAELGRGRLALIT
ncbi:MAG: trypsin-like peptidase domain-containing protein [Pseudomonadota bacterium]